MFRDHVDYVWRVARTLVGPSLADDVAQDVFVVVRRRLPEFRGDSLRAWLFTIVRNVARTHRRGDARRQRRLEMVPTPPPQRGPEQWLELEQAADLLEAALGRLDEDKRIAFVLHEVEGLTCAEIGGALGQNPRTIYSRVRAARATVARIVERQQHGEHS